MNTFFQYPVRETSQIGTFFTEFRQIAGLPVNCRQRSVIIEEKGSNANEKTRKV